MRHTVRGSLMMLLAFVLLMGVMPAGASGAVTMTWERNWGTTNVNPALLLDGQFRYPTDVGVDKWGNVFVAGGENGDHRIQMFAPDGTFVRKVGTVGSGSALLGTPFCVTADRWGNVYVGEHGNGGRVHMFSPELYSEVRTWDGSMSSAVTDPLKISVSLDGTVYLAENGYMVQTWSTYGDFGGYWSTLGVHTWGIAAAHDGNIYTTTSNVSGITHALVKYDRYGNYLGYWGGYGTAAGLFRTPYDVEVDPLEHAFVIEAEGSRGQVFEPDGTHLATFGSGGVADGQFNTPYGIGVGLDRTVYVADTFNHRISKWNVTTSTDATQVAGTSRITTAVQASKRAYPGTAPNVIITTGYNWPDALGGAALAGAVGGPILLTDPDTLPAAVAAEIDRLGSEKAYILGGESAVSDAVYDAVLARPSITDIERLGGGNRYETAILIARELKQVRGSEYDGTAFVCTGANFPDALAAAPIAAANGWPIYLTPTASLPTAVRDALLETWGGNPSNHGYIIGGESAVSEAVETALATPPFFGFGRHAGTNRYATAAAVAEIGYDGMGMLWSRPAIATGEDFPDALAGGVLQGNDCSVLLLTPTDSLHPAAAAALAANKDMIYEVRFLGGTGAVSTATRNAAKALLW